MIIKRCLFPFDGDEVLTISKFILYSTFIILPSISIIKSQNIQTFYNFKHPNLILNLMNDLE